MEVTSAMLVVYTKSSIRQVTPTREQVQAGDGDQNRSYIRGDIKTETVNVSITH